ncbi:MAG: serine/threonine-protein kinase [Candidatus Binataceae bacterium]
MATDLETMSTIASPIVLSGRYRLGRKLGGGGMKVVYLAEDLRLNNRLCAVAEMIDNFANPEEQQQAILGFQREADMLARLKDEHIIQIFDKFSERQNHYLVMEYVEGGTFQDLIIAARGGMPQAEVIDIALQILATLEYLHGLTPPIIYRDMKPANVMVTPAGKVRLIDFGIARFFQNATMTTFGTPGYAPKEQYGGMVEARSDLYSLGATLHHALSGRIPVPFDFPNLISLRSDCSKELSDLLARSLADKIEQRIPSAREFRLRLEAIKANLAAHVQIPVPEPDNRDSTQPLQTISTAMVGQTAVTNPQSEPFLELGQDATTPMQVKGTVVDQGSWLLKEESISESLTRRVEPLAKGSTDKSKSRGRRIIIPAIAVCAVIAAAVTGYSYWKSQQEELAHQEYIREHPPKQVIYQPTPLPVQPPPEPAPIRNRQYHSPVHHHVHHYYRPPEEEAGNPYPREVGNEPYPYQQPTPTQSQGSGISGIEGGAIAGVIGGVIGGVASGLLGGNNGSSSSPPPRRYYPRRTR